MPRGTPVTRLVAVFDFDETIVNGNSDVLVPEHINGEHTERLHNLMGALRAHSAEVEKKKQETKKRKSQESGKSAATGSSSVVHGQVEAETSTSGASKGEDSGASESVGLERQDEERQRTNNNVTQSSTPHQEEPTMDYTTSLLQWTNMMSAVLLGATKSQVDAAVAQIPPVAGIDRVIGHLNELDRAGCDVDVYVVSDANTYFIEQWMTNCFPALGRLVRGVFSNPLTWDEGRSASKEPVVAGVQWYMPDSHDCSTCSARNLCKGTVLSSHIMVDGEKRRRRRRSQDVAGEIGNGSADDDSSAFLYFGDGTNDLCPMLRLRPGSRDVAFPRRGFSLEKRLARHAAAGAPLPQCTTVLWNDGNDLVQHLEQLFPL